MKTKILLFLIFFIPYICYAQEQAGWCGTQQVAGGQKEVAQIEYLQSLVSYETSAPTYLPIRFMIVSPTDTNFLTKTEVMRILDYANEVFKPAEMYFFPCEDTARYFSADTLPANYNYQWILNSKLYKDHTYANVIEVWVFPRLSFEGLATVNAPPSRPIYLNIAGAKSINTLTHELGHFFGLSHTMDDNRTELVNGSNCQSAADNLCDTPADPGLNNRVDADCVYRNTSLKDALGQAYHPLTNNIMSSSPRSCRNAFTPQQIEIMRWGVKTKQSYLKGCPDWKYKITKTSPTYPCTLPVTVHFAANSPASDSFAWDFDADGTIDSQDPNPSFSYTKGGTYDVSLWLRKGSQTIQLVEKSFVSVGAMPFPYFEDFERYFLQDMFSVGSVFMNFPHFDDWQTLPKVSADSFHLKPEWRVGKQSLLLGDHSYSGTNNMAMFPSFGPKNNKLDTIFLESPCVFIPALTQTPRLSFWYHCSSTALGAMHFDLFVDQDTIFDISAPMVGAQQLSDTSAYKQLEINLSAYRGKAVRLRFRCNELSDTEPGVNYYRYILDDFLVHSVKTISILSLPTPITQVAEVDAKLLQANTCRKSKYIKIPLRLSQPIGNSIAVITTQVTGNALPKSDYDLPEQFILELNAFDSLFLPITIYEDQDPEGVDSLVIRLSLSGNSDLFLKDSILKVFIIDDDVDIDFDKVMQYGTDTLLKEDFENYGQNWLNSGFDIGDYAMWRSRNNFNTDIDVTMGTISNPNNKFGYAYLGNEYFDKNIWFGTPNLSAKGYASVHLSGDFHISPIGGGDYSIDFVKNLYALEKWQPLKIPNFCKAWTKQQFELPKLAELDSFRIGFHHRGFNSFDELMMDNILVLAEGLPAIDTSFFHSASSYLGPYQKVNLFSYQDSSIIASIENLSNHDFGCIEAKIQSSGQGAFLGVTGQSLMKTIQVKSENPKDDVKVNFTYFAHKAELLGWESATHVSPLALKAIKGNSAFTPTIPANIDWLVLEKNRSYSQFGHRYMTFTTSGVDAYFGIGVDIPSNIQLIENQPIEWYCFPNPAKEQMQIVCNSNEEFQVRVLNMLSQVVVSSNAKYQNFASLDLLSLPTGSFLVELTTTSTQDSKVFFIQH
jgi:PKD repeat protein